MKSLINILNETITSKSLKKLQEGEHRDMDEPLINPEITPPNDESNHYLDKTPDKGWKEFWMDWNGDDKWLDLSASQQDEYRDEAEASSGKETDLQGPTMSLTDEEFLVKYGKSREDFKKRF